ncbi:hypothetical protein ETAA8_37290 [Anatilimnocola aggregata]|uniref:DUF1501 domain-containing protein n=1 Tax=Anatilimnocola aggregata TaxID=2528021 RepID=A0A517YEG7_9BACT|nr:DUF1501 domain-containing protein [Anatilimnocola aggregata]QDU28626.1 hypothetical protein ETAA8_37290 [Anatilimnocola aggregata]
MTTHRYCDGIARRDFLRVGALGSAGLSLASYLRATEAGEVQPAKGKSAIFVYLGGGPPHLDTFDLKPDAPAEFRGEFNPIETNVSGIQVCEHLPQLAKCADKYAIVRGISHTLAGHELGTSYVNSGSRPVPSLIYPGYGSVISRELTGASDLPHFVAIPNTPQRAGYLGVRYAPLQTNSTPSAGVPYSVRGISLGSGKTPEQFSSRNVLLEQLDTGLDEFKASSKLVDGLDRFGQQAFDLISSPRAREAFDVSLEDPKIAEPFGKTKFGQSCLLATRLVEAGVRFATVSFGGWDTHSGNFKKCKESLLPELDQGLSGLFTTLDQKGLLASTTVFVIGEFGRTPKINDKAGRDHWPRAMFALLAGGGIKGGQVLGASDDKGQGPAGDGFTPDQLAASFYHSLGIDFRKEYHTSTGRPVTIVREGTVIPQLFS